MENKTNKNAGGDEVVEARKWHVQGPAQMGKGLALDSTQGPPLAVAARQATTITKSGSDE